MSLMYISLIGFVGFIVIFLFVGVDWKFSERNVAFILYVPAFSSGILSVAFPFSIVMFWLMSSIWKLIWPFSSGFTLASMSISSPYSVSCVFIVRFISGSSVMVYVVLDGL